MKARHFLLACLGLACCFVFDSASIQAATTIDSYNKYSYFGNASYVDWTDGISNLTSGANIGAYVCSNYIYVANMGWVSLGSGSPANGIYYQNIVTAGGTNDWGVNLDGYGNLRGYAYGANFGWVNFEGTGAPAVDMITGAMTGSVWSANVGWVGLTNSYAFVQTDTISPGALDPNGSGLPIAWELQNFTNTDINSNYDQTGKGMTAQQDYLAGTVPSTPQVFLKLRRKALRPTEPAPHSLGRACRRAIISSRKPWASARRIGSLTPAWDTTASHLSD